METTEEPKVQAELTGHAAEDHQSATSNGADMEDNPAPNEETVESSAKTETSDATNGASKEAQNAEMIVAQSPPNAEMIVALIPQNADIVATKNMQTVASVPAESSEAKAEEIDESSMHTGSDNNEQDLETLIQRSLERREENLNDGSAGKEDRQDARDELSAECSTSHMEVEAGRESLDARDCHEENGSEVAMGVSDDHDGAENGSTGAKNIETTDIDKKERHDTDTVDENDGADKDEEEEVESDVNAASSTRKKLSDTEEEDDQEKVEDRKVNAAASTRNKLSGDEDDDWERPWRASNVGKQSQKKQQPVPQLRSFWSTSDTDDYLNGYPGKKDYPRLTANIEFYKNERQSKPDGDYIDEIHSSWWGKYRLLEQHHGYIQWLFPIRESGLNWYAQELQLHEAKTICQDKAAHARVLKSYEMMLDFYGMRLKDPSTGEIERASNWKSRFANLNRSMHNYLRITRILKCLGELELEHLKAPFVRFCIHEAFETRELRNVSKSCREYWIYVIRDEKQRRELVDLVVALSTR